MRLRRSLAICVLLSASGCLYHVSEKTDEVLGELTSRPYDQTASSSAKLEEAPRPRPATEATLPSASPRIGSFATAADVRTTALMEANQAPAERDEKLREIQERLKKLRIPEAIPGSETPPLTVPAEPAAQQAAIKRLYLELPPLPAEPKPLPGPDGQPYTLAALQALAAENSPQLRQAVSDVEAARGNWIQARAYPNPTVGLQISPSNDGSVPGVWGPSVAQTVSTGGKLKLQAAAAEMDLRNSELALRRARSDLATQVRNAYYALLIAKETMRVNKALVSFTDEVYKLQAELLQGGFAAPYEPAGLRAQAYTARLAYTQSMTSYIYAWKQLVGAVGLRQLPLTEVAGRIDRLIPSYDYDAVLAYVLRNHTDVLTARNAVDKARYSLKLAQITPLSPDVTFSVAVQKEYALPPFQWSPTASVTFPLSIWDRNRGNITAAEAALVRASEEPHRVEVTLRNSLSMAYAGYKNNVQSLEYYRKFILPDQVRYYRGVFERRRVDPSVAFGDLVTAQQTLATDIGSYLGILGQLWPSVVSVADFLQTDDLFQVAQPKELPPLPDLEHPLPWACPHGSLAAPSEENDCTTAAAPPSPAGAVMPKEASVARTPLHEATLSFAPMSFNGALPARREDRSPER
jgi:cobalt-zinc-cadmium efflux system outer membrane protein